VTLYELAIRARGDLENAGVSSTTAALDAELLARHVLGWDRAAWLTRRDNEADESFTNDYATVLARRTAREPVAYIRGVQEFWGRDFVVTPAVLIPRHETELTIEVAQSYLGGHPDALVVDVGTGSGCIAITLALEHPTARVYATDISADALIIARENAARLGAHRIRFLHGSYLADAPRPIDLIVTNPPYVAATDRPALAPEVKEHEPAVALFGGNDGLAEVRAILRHAPAALAPGGCLVMEMGYGQDDRVANEVAAVPGLLLQEIRSDLQGIPRVAIVRRLP
jgi:release factor glutamine methyltransferase